MKKKLSVRLLSVLLCLVMMFVCLQASASALSLDDLQQAIDKLAYYTMANLPDGLTAHLNEGWSRAKLDTADAEQLNLLTTIDPDGTKTLYSYDTPIKYVDDEGYIRFIDSSIKPTLLAESLVDWYAYENTANEVKTYFPLFINTGVLIEDYSFSIRMTPDGNNSMVGRDGDYVQYEDVFGQGVDIRYTAINTGVKEDIVIAEYNGDNTFEYIVETEGLAPIRTAGKTVEFYDYTLNLSYTFGEIVMFDADNKTATDNSYTVEELEDGKYLVTLIVDQEFLAADDTAYPVVVDPTVRQTNNDKNFCSSNYFASATYCDQSVDVLTAENGTASSAIHLQMTDMQNFSHINPEKITRAHLNLYFDQQIADEITFNVNAVNFSTEPTQASLTWDTVEQVINGSPESSMSVVSGTSAVGLVITEIFRDWLTVETKSYMLSTRISKSDGLFVSATGMSNGGSILVCAPANPNNAVWPSVSVTYTEDDELETGFYRIQSGYYYDGARYLTATSTGNVIYDLDESNPNQLWYIEKSTDDNLYPDDDSLEGSYIIYNVGRREYMSFSANSVNVDWYTQFEQPAQTASGCNLKIVGQSNGYHRIVSTGTHNQLSVLNYYKENSSPVIQDKMKGLDNQRWKFHKVDSFVVANGETSHQMVVGEKKYLSYTFVDLNATFSISSSDPDSNVISYRETSSGFATKYITVEAVGEGSATLTVTMTTEDEETGGKKTSTASWSFAVGPQTITINKESLSLNIGGTEQIIANPSPWGIDVVWTSSNEDVATVDEDGYVTAVDVGEARVTATISNGESAECEVSVYSTDPFHRSNIEYARYTRITGKDYWGLGNDTDHTISIVKSCIYSYDYFIAHDNINGGYSREYAITNDLKNTLNDLEEGYQAHYNIIPAFDTTTNSEQVAHYAKVETDQLVDIGYFTHNSSEYYGTWAYNYTSTLNLVNYWRGVIDTATAAYGVYLTITSFYYSYLSSTSTTSISLSSNQYNNMTSYLDDIDDAMNGISFQNKKIISAEERNASLRSEGYNNPYQAGTPVVKFTQSSTTQYVRVYSNGINSPTGRWIMKYSDIQGLTPSQIQSKFALENTPTHYCFVNVPAGTQVYTGIVGENFGHTAGQAVQFELGTIISVESYGTGIPLS